MAPLKTPHPTLQVPPHSPGSDGGRGALIARAFYLFVLLFGFLVAIETMSKAIKALADIGILGGGAEGELFAGVNNPFAGLAIGVLFTVIVQSSSTTTATIVAVVGTGNLSVEHAVPMIMGANIGTTITNTIVSIGHVRSSHEFRRAFAAATVHDFFNLLAVATLLPLELYTGFLSKTAHWMTDNIGLGGGAEFKSPIKTSIKTVHHWIQDGLGGLGLEGKPLGVACLVLGVALTFLCLYQITKNMRIVIAGRIESAMTRALDAHGFAPIAIGIALTAAVQSSSITTSLLVPMCASGVMKLKKAFPIMLGANIGTTVTAMLASMAADQPAGLTIAFVHVLFNTIAVTVCYTIKPLREFPLRLAEALARLAARSPIYVLAYVGGVFIAVPLAGWLLCR